MNGEHHKIIMLRTEPFDKLRTNGINQSFPGYKIFLCDLCTVEPRYASFIRHFLRFAPVASSRLCVDLLSSFKEILQQLMPVFGQN